MPLSWNEIRSRAITFTKEWEGESRERAEKDTFWNQFLNVYGISRRRVATFEEPVRKLNKNYGFIDLFWKGTLLIEHKSKGQNLDKAYSQALDYFSGLKDHELPRYVLVSDFEKFRLYDLDTGEDHQFELKDFIDHIHLFGFIAGWERREIREEDPVNIEAAELMGQLHDRLQEIGYTGHDLEVYLVRLLFCLFADDTGIFEKGIFEEYIRLRTAEDGSDLSYHIAQIFQTLNTAEEHRLSNIDESINAFPYVNGQLFEEPVRIASFDADMREMLLDACILDWGEISPAIFGSMFQAAMNPQERRNLGAHYTSEKNILKVIKPLFLDDLYDQFEKAKGKLKKLQALHDHIASLSFLDPACGSGNFLIITYRELRQLEILLIRELLRIQFKGLNVGFEGFKVTSILKVSINHFYGIEYEEFASKVAEVGMWLVEHQMNEVFSLEFGQNVINLPLRESANIVHGNSLRIDWEEVVPKDQLNYIIGNPPFYGASFQSKEQKADLDIVCQGMKSYRLLDYVSAWYIKAARYIQDTTITVAFVSTNSITQGEQVAILWHQLFNVSNVQIHFAHRTFQWQNEAKGKAAVHVIIIGFGLHEPGQKLLFEYDDIRGEPLVSNVKNINPYLIEGRNLFVTRTKTPISGEQKMVKGNQPTDGGNFIFSTDKEKDEFINQEPDAAPFIRKYIGSRELINGSHRWCLWLVNISPQTLKKLPMVLDRVKKVKENRLLSTKAPTVRKASTPTLFDEIRHTGRPYLAIPEVSSERRNYLPIGYLQPEIIASNKAYMLPDATVYQFGMISSIAHMSWTKMVGGRLKSDPCYSNGIVYNNFPWPKDPTDKQKEKVESTAQAVLDTRAKYPDSSLADLYDPLTMPPDLVRAHQALDKAVDRCYRPQPFPSERSRIEYLFQLYEEYTAPLLAVTTKKTKKKK